MLQPFRSLSAGRVLLLGTAVRLALLLCGEWQDAHFAVKYTDIDYAVVTDAAAAVAAGGSPFDRATFRYTPLLAWAVLPNIWLFRAAGKALFAAADILAGWLVSVLLARQGASPGARAAAVAAWLFNPFTATISTRGSAEALVVVQLLGLLLALDAGHTVTAGALFGLAVHWRIYPVIYALPILLSLPPPLTPGSRQLASEQSPNFAAASGGDGEADSSSDGDQVRLRRGVRKDEADSSSHGRHCTGRRRSVSWARRLRSLLSRQRLEFALSAAGVFLGLMAAFYCLYGWRFIEEAYLYHTVRRDPRHNFSPLYYSTFLSLGVDAWDAGVLVSRTASAAQLAAVAALGWRFSAHLPTAWLLQTLAFVTFNKVVTAQYFVWYFSLAPLVLPTLRPTAWRRVCVAVAVWAAAVAHWLGWAYLLEFRGAPVHMGIWAAGVAFLAANTSLLCVLAGSVTRPEAASQQSPTRATKAD